MYTLDTALVILIIFLGFMIWQDWLFKKETIEWIGQKGLGKEFEEYCKKE